MTTAEPQQGPDTTSSPEAESFLSIFVQKRGLS